MEAIKLSVHSLVERVLRCGDIDNRYVDSSALYEGAAAHRKIQKSMGEEYHAEISLKITLEADGQPVQLQGRADGIFTDKDILYIDEIKTTTMPLEQLRRQEMMHWGQAQCYAYMLLHTMDSPPSRIGVQLTYYQLHSEEIKRIEKIYRTEEIDDAFHELWQRYTVFARLEREWAALRNESIEAFSFPYPSYRRGQRELAAAVYRAIGQEKKLYVQAPTGIGKTLSTLFPAVKAMPHHRLDKLFYLTAKTVTRTVAQDAVQKMLESGLRLKSLTLRAKEKICFCDTPSCNPVDCPFASGHYDRVNDALLELIQSYDLILPSSVEEIARAHRVCPYELSLDAALWADVVVCDYNHVFDPVVYLRRFFDLDEERRYVFLIDEAHNLADRVRDMYSVTLRKSPFSRLSRQLRDKDAASSALRKTMRQINRYLLDERKALGDASHRADPELDAVASALIALFCEAAEDWLAQHETHPLHDELLELMLEAGAYQAAGEYYNERFVTLTQVEEGELSVTRLCLNPADIIADRLQKAVSSTLFSATLTPLPYYREILGGGTQDVILTLPSPYDPNRLLLLAHAGISTKYRDRAKSYAPIAEAIHTVVSARRGNYLVYFPSYDYMRKVVECYREMDSNAELLVQNSQMDELERERFLGCFEHSDGHPRLGFCVLGGIFSEGIDLKGDRLIGSIIVGVGLPGLSQRQEEIRNYFDRQGGCGYDYAYVYPGMNKVLQAAGRVIRSEEDFGIVLLIDTRFDTAKYRALFPAHWANIQILRSQTQLDAALAAHLENQ